MAIISAPAGTGHGSARIAPGEMRPGQTAAMSDATDPRPPRAHKGRGAASNPEGRFETVRRHAEDDGERRSRIFRIRR